MSIINRKFLLFLEDDNESTSNDSVDNTDDISDSNNYEIDNKSDTDSSDNQEGDNSDEIDNKNSEDDDYDIDSEPDEVDNSEDNNSNAEEDINDSSDDNDTDNNSDADTEEKAIDRELFNSLSDSEKERKISTLKELYKDLYNKCSTLIEKFNQLTDEDDEFKPVIKRILTVLYDLKEYVSYYILNVYDKTSYIENDINFNRYLSTLNGIKLTVEELEKIKKKENK